MTRAYYDIEGLDDDEVVSLPNLKLFGSDGGSVDFHRDLLKYVGVLSTMSDLDKEETEFKFDKIPTRILQIVRDFVELNKSDTKLLELPRPLPWNKTIKDVVGDKYVQFIDIDPLDLIETINAANYLDVPCLVQLMAVKIAWILHDHTEEEAREIFQCFRPYTKAEYDAVMEDVAWALDV